MRVLNFEWIEGPFQQIDAVLDRVVTLGQLQPPTESVVAVAVANGEHVRMKIWMSGAAAGNGEGKTDQLAAIECADNLPANLLADNEHPQRNQVNIVKIPDFFLQRDAVLEFLHAFTLANGYRADFGDRDAHFAVPSMVLACCHKASISSRLACSSVRPFLCNCSSSQPKRRRNFLLVRRKADSGSTER